MFPAKKAWPLQFLAVVALVAAGCGGTPPPVSPQEGALKQIHEIYEHFIKSQEKPPAQLSDLTQRRYEGIYPGAVQALQRGKYVVVWGVMSKDAGTVLAYAKDAPTQGGAVLMADGTVKEMTVDEFKAAQRP
jgi:hypothetical protein